MTDFFNAIVYTRNSLEPAFDITQIPITYALRVDLDYESGTKVVLIYAQMPSQDERRELMWKLQNGARRGHYKITVSDEVLGTVFEAPAI